MKYSERKISQCILPLRQAKLFCIYCINVDVGIKKPLFFFNTIFRWYKQKSLLGGGKICKMLATNLRPQGLLSKLLNFLPKLRPGALAPRLLI